jgi:phosphate transport system substrate-binding protein
MIFRAHTVFFSLTLVSLALIAPRCMAADTVRFHGAVTMSKIVTEHMPALEAQTGIKLEVVGNGAGRGLADLGAGNADIAMLAGSLKGVADAVNAEKPGSVDTAGMKDYPIAGMDIVFVAHPAVGIKTLRESQAKDLLSGKVVNWKEIGGADQAVKVVLPFAGDGARVTIKEEVMKGSSFAPDAIVRSTSKDISPIISQLPGSLSFLTKKNAVGLEPLAFEKPIVMSQSFVTQGEPSGDIQKVLDAVLKMLK